MNYAAQPEYNSSIRADEKKSEKNDIRSHNYTDENSALLFQHVKYEYKTESGEWDDSWRFDVPLDKLTRELTRQSVTHSLEDVQKVPYNLPALAAATGTDLIVNGEGEKDCDVGIKFGYVATCSYSPKGHWEDEWNKWIVGKDIVVVRDNDQAGFEGGLKRAEKFAKVARRVRILDLPDVGWKGDLADWAQGKSADDFQTLIDEAAWVYFDSSLPEGEKFPRRPLRQFMEINKGQTYCIFASVADCFAAMDKEGPFSGFFNDVVPVAIEGGIWGIKKTDFSSLKLMNVAAGTPVYVWMPNSAEGRAFVPEITRKINHRCEAIMPDDAAFGEGWTLGSGVPSRHFKRNGQAEFYAGPKLEEMSTPATYLCKKSINPETGKPIYPLRDHAASEWKYLILDDVFIHDRLSHFILKPEAFDATFGKYAYKTKVAKKVKDAANDMLMREAYDPTTSAKIISFEGQRCFNSYDGTPDAVARMAPAADIKPFLDFIEYLVPDADERIQLLRWSATLVARPERKMLCAVVLKSRAQGIGKGIFTDRILAPLVGWQNVSHPSEKIILDKFNSWWFKKRAAIVSEIHAGHTMKAYNELKDVVTEPKLLLRRMHSDPYDVANFCHLFLTSNEANPIMVAEKDRRWIVVSGTEKPESEKYFSEFIKWLKDGGVSAIGKYFREFEEHRLSGNALTYMREGERAPVTASKSEMIESSKSEEQRYIETIVRCAMYEDVNSENENNAKTVEVVLWDKAITTMAKDHFRQQGKTIYITDADVRNTAAALGMHQLAPEVRPRRGGEKMKPLLNDMAFNAYAADKNWLAKYMKKDDGKRDKEIFGQVNAANYDQRDDGNQDLPF